MKEIKIRLYTPRELWMKYLDRLEHEAADKTEENWKEVKEFKDRILHHIDREPIPRENKDYLRKQVNEEYYQIRLFPVWPKIKSDMKYNLYKIKLGLQWFLIAAEDEQSARIMCAHCNWMPVFHITHCELIGITDTPRIELLGEE